MDALVNEGPHTQLFASPNPLLTPFLDYCPKKVSDFREWIDARVIDTKNKSEELQEISCLKKWLKPIYILHLTSSLGVHRRRPGPLEESFIFLTK